MKNSILNHHFIKISRLRNLSQLSRLTKSFNLSIFIFLIITNPASSQVMLKGMAVVTCFADSFTLNNPVAAVYDIRNNLTAPIGQNWNHSGVGTVPIYNSLTNWTVGAMGEIFGIAIDKNYNVYFGASQTYGTLGKIGPAGNGGIYKADGTSLNSITTIISTLNSAVSSSFPNSTIPNTGGLQNGIGNIAYDLKHHQLFATNLEDGRIYRIDLNTSLVLSSYDPFMLDNGLAGMPSDSSERIYGIGVYTDNSDNVFVYFARNPKFSTGLNHEIWSVPLNSLGEFTGANISGVYSGNETLKISFKTNSPFNSITDIAFNSSDRMLVAERGHPHAAITREYQLISGTWNFHRDFYTGGATNKNTAGGVDYGYKETVNGIYDKCDSIAWTTSNFLCIGINCYYGLQGMNSTNGNLPLGVNDIIVDLNGVFTTADKGEIGDVEVARDPCNIVNYTLACDNHINVSMDTNCCVTITPDMVLQGNYPQNCVIVILKDQYGRPIPGSPTVCNAFIGQTLQYEVLDTCTKNRCWGTLKIEDKFPPQIVCEDPDTVFCNQSNYSWTPPIVIDNCSGIAKAYILSDITIENSCDSFCIAERRIQYYYIDSYGNRSDTCLKKICYKKFNSQDVLWPKDTIFSCEQWSSVPPPNQAGVPSSGGFPLWPDWGWCKVTVSYQDQIIPICPKSFKVLRKWTIINWCPVPINEGIPKTEILEHYQLIKVVDEKGPVVVCSPDLTVSTDVWSCTGTAIIPPPRVIRECSNTSLAVGYKIVDQHGVPTYEGTSKNNIIKLPNGYYSISGLPLGLSWVVFHVTDECGNSTDCFTEVTVEDNVPPVAVCDQTTIVSLTVDGTAKIEAFTFDDGSLDNCMIDRFEVKRMDNGIPCNTINGNQWGANVFFCCADIGMPIMVSLRVWDKAGNSNTCMVEVVVQDKIPPVIFCPPHITVSCEFDFHDLSVFGNVVRDFNSRKPILISDPKVKHSAPLIDGYAYDGCGVVVKELPAIYNLTCNQGTISRTFEAIDISGYKALCTQIITIQDFNPNNVTIQWPNDFLSNSNCTSTPKLQPEITGKPLVSGADKCNQIMINHEDQVFTLEPDACIKILRKWIVIDWCIYQANNPTTGGYWSWTQIIKVNNSVAPEITSLCSDRNIDVVGPGCGGDINLKATAKDDCTDSADLVWYHSVDLYNDGLSHGLEYLRSGLGSDVIGNFPVGKHKISFSVKDACGNESKCSYIINVVDAKKPTPYCNSSITTTIMPSNKSIGIWAKDFNINSEDNCTAKENLEYYFLINNVKIPSLNLDCSHIGLNTLRMYVEDEAGNSDYCEVTLDLQDPNKVCGGTFVTASGNLITSDGRFMTEAKVLAVNSNTGSTKEIAIKSNGSYSFNDLAISGNYRIKAKNDEDHGNGVSTQDIILIQKHLLGQQSFDNPYQYIAADANNSGSITASDISEIRKLILGINSKFTKNESWRFIPKTYTFNDPENPFPFEEEIQHLNITTNCINDDFYAVKIGDINGDVVLLNMTSTRTLRSCTLEVENKTVRFKENVRIPIYASQDMSILGIQLALQLSKGLKISAIEKGALPIQSEQYVVNQNDLVLSFTNNNVIYVKAGEVLFYIDVINESIEDIYSEVRINSNKLNAEVYDATTNAYSIKMHVRNNSDQESKLKLYQNAPNPFRDKTYIQFLSSNTDEAKFQIIDLNGKMIYEKMVSNSASIQSFEIEESILSHSGVYLVKLSSQNEIATIKIVKFN